MALMPKRVKYRKQQRGRAKGCATRGNYVAFGDFGLQSLDAGWITASQIESGRVTANQVIRGEGRMYIRIFPDKPVSSKPAETRMGKGKGEPDHYVAVVKPGTVLYEIAGVPEDMAKHALARIAHKLPIRVRMVRRHPKV